MKLTSLTIVTFAECGGGNPPGGPAGERPRVRPGSRLRTPVGVLEVVSVEPVAASAIDAESARRAGAASKAELLRLMAGRPGRIHRVELRLAGPDERIALRADDAL